MNAPYDLPNSLSLDFVEELYADYLRDPSSVAPSWRAYFESTIEGSRLEAVPRLGPGFPRRSIFNARGGNGKTPARDALGERIAAVQQQLANMAVLQHRVDELIRNYRVRGHILARIDPLDMLQREAPELDPAFYHFTEAEMDLPFSTEMVGGHGEVVTLRKIIERMRNTYCRSIGVQYMHIDNLAVREWLQDHMEGTENRLKLTREQQLRIFTRLVDAVIFEEFIQRKYVGAKRFSLEGAESLIPLLDLAIEKAGELGVEEIVLGMAHRGRLNVLANIMGKSPRHIFREFDDRDPSLQLGRGDVKYHLGHHSNWVTAEGKTIHLALCFNPSHLEFVNPVALGRVRARQDRYGDTERERGLLILIHGDAAFAGEGIVQETLNLGGLTPYTTGGTIHVLVNNQIGFTTTPREGRSTLYATSVARMLPSPVFHVNGEDPEAVAQVIHLALEFRRAYRRDVVIDMYCYRRWGHNEGDEPSFTQPVMYRRIEARKSVRDGYLEHLLALGEVTRAEAEEIAANRRALLEQELSRARSEEPEPVAPPSRGLWAGYRGGPDADVPEVETGVPVERLSALLRLLARVPEGFTLHPKLVRFIEQRQEMAAGTRPLDWAAGEALAFATLATEGVRVRMSGQDSQRGTFSQRHAVWHDYENGQTWSPFAGLAPDQAPVEIFNSPLSEAGVLGFEYGYSIASPDWLVLWEAQFGDFANAAQVIIDQFITSAEDKWGSLSGLVLLLPHGFEGQGPEHSSARLERFLTLAAEDNIQVIYPSTPSQLFHALRRQIHRPWRKPLVVMTPKSLLRHPRCVSSLEDFARGGFARVLPDPAGAGARAIRVLLCSGKIFYELIEERERLGRRDVDIVRLEQLYPLRDEHLEPVLAPYMEGTPIFWVQEEPENMGAWRHLRSLFGRVLLNRFPLFVISREASASPATGSLASHRYEQARLLAAAFSQ